MMTPTDIAGAIIVAIGGVVAAIAAAIVGRRNGRHRRRRGHSGSGSDAEEAARLRSEIARLRSEIRWLLDQGERDVRDRLSELERLKHELGVRDPDIWW